MLSGVALSLAEDILTSRSGGGSNKK